MKKTFLNSLTICTLFFATALNAQVGVGVPSENIHPSAELEVKSTTKGFLPPRMTMAERDAIVTPAAGLLIYQTDGDENNTTTNTTIPGIIPVGCTSIAVNTGPTNLISGPGLYYYDGTSWKNVVGPQGEKGIQGFQGIQGETGAVGAQGIKGDKGDQGPVGTGISSGTSKNQLMYWNGSAWVTLNPGTNGQVLTVSDGDLIWTLIEGYGKPITDIDGNVYRTVIIGNQQWMAENLKVSQYNDGTDIPNIQALAEWSGLTTGAWAYYENNESKYAKYGKLYNWYAVSPDNKNVCPTGWHVPNHAEWTVLIDYLGGQNVAGGKMKEVGTTSWNFPNTGAANTSLFTGLPGGGRYANGNYGSIDNGGYWWSSSEDAAGNAWYRTLNSYSGLVGGYDFNKRSGLSVRCLRD